MKKLKKSIKKSNKAIKKGTIKTIKQLKHATANRDLHDDIGTASKFTKKAGDGLMFASSIAEAAGQPEVAAPLALAGGGALSAHKGLHEVHKSKLLKRSPPKKKI
jgi:hypothetical protein